MSDGKEEQQPMDDRFKWMSQRVTASMKNVKEEKWKELMDKEASIATAMNFFEGDQQSVFVYVNAEDELQISDKPPKKIEKKKAVYFTKGQQIKITKDKPIPTGAVMYGDITDDVLGMLQAKMDSVFIPLIKSSTKTWPELLQKDVAQQCDVFSQQVQIIKGRQTGKYVLPTPISVVELRLKLRIIESGTKHKLFPSLPSRRENQTLVSLLTQDMKDDISQIEQTVLEWIRQIRHLIHFAPEDVKENQKKSTPKQESDFWENKKVTIEELIKLLYRPEQQAVRDILGLVKSSYFQALEDSIQELKEEFVRCESSAQFLKPLVSCCEVFSDGASREKQLEDGIKAFFYGLQQIWYYAPFYGNQTRFTFLIRAIANQFIDWSICVLSNQGTDGKEVIKTPEIPAMILNVQLVCKSADLLIQRYNEVATSVKNDMEKITENAIDEDKKKSILQRLVEVADLKLKQDMYKDNKKFFDDMKAKEWILEGESFDELQHQKVPEVKYEKHMYKKGERWPAMALVFKRLESFIERMKDIHKILQIRNAFANLDPDKFEIGGVQGDKLSSQLKRINQLFNQKITRLTETTYDPTDVSETQFSDDLQGFMKHYQSLEKRLTAILVTSIETAVTIEQAISCFEVFSEVLNEQILKSLALKYFPMLNQQFKMKLEDVVNDFQSNEKKPTLEPNTPMQSGKVFWARVCINRVRIPYIKLEALQKTYLANERDDLFEQNKLKYSQFVTKINDYETNIYDTWKSSVDNKCVEKLKENLLKRQVVEITGEDDLLKGKQIPENGIYKVKQDYKFRQQDKEQESFIEVDRIYELDKPQLLLTNFSQELFDILSETKLFKILNKEIPTNAQDVYDKGNEYRSVKNQLDDIVCKYNFIQKQLYFVERPLFYNQLKAIEDEIKAGTDTLRWSDYKDKKEEVELFIKKIRLPIEVLYSQVLTLKDSLKNIEELMKSWAKQPMIDRPPKSAVVIVSIPQNIQTKIQSFKKDNLTKIKQFKDGNTWEVDVDKITANISKAKNAVFLKEVKELFSLSEEAKLIATQIVLTTDQQDALKKYWEFYQIWLSEYLQSGLLEIILANILQLQKYMDGAETTEHNDFFQQNITAAELSYPFIEIEMHIGNAQLYFKPGVDQAQAEKMLDAEIKSWIDDMLKVCSIVFNPISASSIESLRFSSLNNYQLRIQQNPKYETAVKQLLQRVQKRQEIVKGMRTIIDNKEYDFLFKTDKKIFIQRFLTHGPNVPYMEDYVVDPDKEQTVTRTIIKQAQDEEENKGEGQEDEEDGKMKVKKESDNIDEAKITQETKQMKYYRVPDMYDFSETIDKYERIADKITLQIPQNIRIGWLQIKVMSAKTHLLEDANAFRDLFMNNRLDDVKDQFKKLEILLNDASKALDLKGAEFTGEFFDNAMKQMQEIKKQHSKIDFMFDPIKDTLNMLVSHNCKNITTDLLNKFESLPRKWQEVKALEFSAKEKLQIPQQQELQNLNLNIKNFQGKIDAYRVDFYKESNNQECPMAFGNVEQAYQMMDKTISKINAYREEAQQYAQRQALFDQQLQGESKQQSQELVQLNNMEKQLKGLKFIWDYVDVVDTQFKEWKSQQFNEINTDTLTEVVSKFKSQLQKGSDPMLRKSHVYITLMGQLNEFNLTVPLITNLRDKGIKDRHREKLQEIAAHPFSKEEFQTFKLSDILDLELNTHAAEVAAIVECARKELSVEIQLEVLRTNWKNLSFIFIAANDPTQTPLTSEAITEMLKKEDTMFTVVCPEELSTQLETDQQLVATMASSQDVQHFAVEVQDWVRKLSTLDSIIQVWVTVQRTWSYLKPIFKQSEDIRKQLPDDTKRFEQIDQSWCSEMRKIVMTPSALQIAEQKDFLTSLEHDQKNLTKCEKALADYLDTKRRIYPRFYFVSQVDLLDILSKGQQPRMVEKHLSKMFDNIHSLKWENKDDMECKNAIAFLSGEKEEVPFTSTFKCVGQVENWLNDLVTQTRNTLKQCLFKALNSYVADDNKSEWLEKTLAQICIIALQIQWTSDTQSAFDKMAENNEGAMKEYNKKQNDNLMYYIQMIQGNLNSNMRTKISTICTIEVHAKDIVFNLIRDKVSNQQSFAWQSQLKFYWDEKLQDCVVHICDADFMYSYEYLGCQSRLVITPLTDRCYITLTQSLHLNLGGAPAGPAGTGKTETTKDLGRALGRMVYVFNCSPEMDYKSLGNIFYGLSLSGSWGCFDEFNRISVEVLSVVAMQVKSVLDAIRAKKEFFSLEGEEEEKPNMPKARLNRQVGYFITMNPGYAGRAELPDNLKALFRSVSMVVPDFCQITEITLISNGFMDARNLAKKFTTLYSLNKELLSKQDHYDWGLRAIIAICRTAGRLRRTMITIKPKEDKK